MDVQLVREVQDGLGFGLPLNRACFPNCSRDERLLGPFVGLGLRRVHPRSFHRTERQVVDERITLIAVQVAAHVGQFMQQAEPEIVDAVITQGQADDRPPIAQPEGGAVEIRLVQVAHDHERDPVLRQKFLRASRPICLRD